MQDIVFPSNNEKEFIRMANLLGYNSLCFVYPLNNFHKGKYDFKIEYGVLVNEKEIGKSKKICDNLFFRSNDKTRHVMESQKNMIVFDLEEDSKKDFMHQRRSGFNHIMAQLCSKNNIKIGFSFRSLFDVSKRNVLMGRMAANIKLCKKYKVDMVVGSFAKDPFEMRNYNDLRSVFLEMGF
jgi:RNase P/RNase MRP subunit p30